MSSAGGLFFPHPPGLAGRSLMNISMSLWEQNRSRCGVGGGLFLYISHIITCGESKANLQSKSEKKNTQTFFCSYLSLLPLCFCFFNF